MIRKLLLILLLVLAVQVAVAAALFQLVGWWALAALVALNVAFAPVLVKRGLKALFLMPFKAKGAVLRGATARVHSVEHAPEPRRDGAEDGEPAEPREWYYVDVTVTPGPSTGAFRHWEPGELLFARPGAEAIPGDDDEDEVGNLHSLRVWTGTEFGEDEGYKYEGEQRLRLHAGVKPGTRRAQFRYYFELFGDVEFPASKSIGAGA